MAYPFAYSILKHHFGQFLLDQTKVAEVEIKAPIDGTCRAEDGLEAKEARLIGYYSSSRFSVS